MLLGLDGQQPITNDRWINVTQKAHPADLRAGPFLLAVDSWREWDCQTFLSYGYEDPSCTDGVAPLRAYGLGVFHIGFQDATRIHPAPMARPLSRGLRDWGCHTLDFIRLGGSILRRRRGPSLGAYGLGVSHIGFYTVTGDPSCADGAALLQGPTGLGWLISYCYV